MSNPNIEQFIEAQKANNEVLVGLVKKAFDGVEKLAALNLNASREFLDTAVSNADKLSTLKDPKELATVGSTLAQPSVEKVVSYSKSVYELLSSLQKDVVATAEAQFQKASKVAGDAFEKATANAPAGSEAITAAFKSAVAASNQALDSVTAATKQMAEVAESNLKAATEAATKAVSSATAAAGKKK